ncbi:MAG: Holliday junction branch migration protein RuvA [Bacteroidaceae bacterium]|nr:Holliday junction branch migration protein RuvA [Bacteroidaceae bacterium]MDO4995320.1 Holliday junction branch migration protein RuvA [Bacteroidales bacterium]
MIEYVKGRLDDLTPATATVECHGVGYLLNISLNTFSSIQGKEEVRLYVFEAIREDAYVLFGFSTKEERSLFQQLISVSGIGGNTARMILSAYSPAELCDIILNGNDKLLKTVKGLGAKTAQRIIVELRDKVTQLGISPTSAAASDDGAPAINQQVHDDAVEALRALGYPPAPVAKVVRAILKDDPSASVERVIKMAFKML